MTTIKVTVIMLLMSLPVLFSGCAEKRIYLPCPAEKPIRTDLPRCAYDGNKTALAQCVSQKYITLEGDYDILLSRFESCK